MLTPSSILSRLTGYKCQICKQFHKHVTASHSGPVCASCLTRIPQRRNPNRVRSK